MAVLQKTTEGILYHGKINTSMRLQERINDAKANMKQKNKKYYKINNNDRNEYISLSSKSVKLK